jgi:hypothetical protein
MDISVDSVAGLGRVIFMCGFGGVALVDIGFEFLSGTSGCSSCGKGSGYCWTILEITTFTMVPW